MSTGQAGDVGLSMVPASSQDVAPSPVVEGDQAGVLHRFADPGVDLVIWRRELPTGLSRWLSSMLAADLPSGRLLARRMDLFEAALELVGTEDSANRDMSRALAMDIAFLSGRFADVLGAEVVDIRLDAVSTDSCWRFHTDFVAARLLTTYRGPGTQWVDPPDGPRAMDLQRSFPGPVNEFGGHAVGLFKGSRASNSTGIVHRSPKMAGTGETRLLLCINLPSSASPELWKAWEAVRSVVRSCAALTEVKVWRRVDAKLELC